MSPTELASSSLDLWVCAYSYCNLLLQGLVDIHGKSLLLEGKKSRSGPWEEESGYGEMRSEGRGRYSEHVVYERRIK